MYDDILQHTLLTKEQAIVYSALLKAGPSPAGKLYQKTPLKRSLVYKVLDQLVDLGLVKADAKTTKVAVFAPEHPSKIKELFEQKQLEASRAQAMLESIMPQLTSDFNLISGKPGIRVFEGVEGLKKIYEDTLVPDSKIYAFLSPVAPEPSLKEWLNQIYLKKRIAHNIYAYVIAANSDETETYKKQDVKFMRETLIVPYKTYPLEMEVDIYPVNKVAFISYKPEELIGVIIDSPAIHSTMMGFYQLAWAQAESIAKKSKPPSPRN